MNYSEIIPGVYNYLGFRGVEPSREVETQIKSCLDELEAQAQFNYIYKSFSELPEFLNKEPYAGFLSGCKGVMLSAMTLGSGTDLKIKRLFRTDVAKAAIYDCSASAYLEYMSDEFEKTLGDDLTYRFCPGYGGSSIEDLREIFKLIDPGKIGITLNESCFMLPAKSMAGVIGIGKKAEKSCKGCIMLGSCRFLGEGRKCYLKTV